MSDRQAIRAEELDRLVDGELTELERRRLLERLDRTPNGWRACALAFLESQCWRQAIGDTAREAAPARAAAPEVRPASRDGPGGGWTRPARWLALAASLLAAFAAGRWAPMPAGTTAPPVAAVQQPTAPPTERKADAEGAQPEPAASAVAASEQPSSPGDGEPGRQPPLEVVGLVRLGEEEMTSQVVPVVAGPDLDEAWLRAQPPALPDYVRRRLEARGWRVRQARQLLSVELPDRGQVVIPLDTVHYEFVGREVY